MDEFSQMWETPFSLTTRSFPCAQQRPPGLDKEGAEGRLYMANHNLITEVSLLGKGLLVLTSTLVNETNAVSGFGSLGLMTNDCVSMHSRPVSFLGLVERCTADNIAGTWSRPPNFLLVDYYNHGNYSGSVFEVAAQYNNVTYNRSCCGRDNASAGYTILPCVPLMMLLGMVAVMMGRRI